MSDAAAQGTKTATGAEPLIAIESVTSWYGKVEVVSNLTLRVGAGETFALLGRNGAGKSALMRTIMGLQPPVRQSGEIWFGGENITGLPTHEVAGKGIALAPDDRRIFPHLTVEENLRLAQRLTRGRQPRALEEIYDMMPTVGGLRRRGGGGLSGGEQKMVAIARAAVQNPRLMFLDETSEGLSPVMVQALIGIIQALQEKHITLLLADQNLRFCARVAERGCMLERGRLQFEGDIETIYREMTSDGLKLMV